ncbi:MAG: ATP-binding protein [Syntrophaceae bacterium]
MRHFPEEQYSSEKERLFYLAIEHSPIFAFNQDCDLKYTWAYNINMESPEYILGKTDYEIFPENEARMLEELKTDVLREKTGVRIQVKLTFNSNSGFFDLAIEPLCKNGEVIGLKGASFDITETKLYEERLRAAYDEMEESIRMRSSELAWSNEQLKKEIEERRKAEEALSVINRDLEENIRERTTELIATNEDLKREIRERTEAEIKLRRYFRRLQSLASELSLAEERQRRIIANELHERLGQVLAICKMKTAEISEKARTTEFREPLEEIITMIGDVIRDTRYLTKELTPPVLYEFGLISALEWLTEQVQERYKIRIDLDISGKTTWEDHNIQILLYQAVRELLMNCVKHARADHAMVSLRDEGNRIRIEVRDEGVGFDTLFMEWSQGFGLFGIRERLQFIGGELFIESEPGKGTRVTILAPAKTLPVGRRSTDKV